MKILLSVTAGPHQGKEFTFEGHDTFLVGRVKDAHLQLSYDDPYFSRRHFVLEVNPPRCRLMNFKSRNGTYVNGEKVSVTDIKDGDVIKAGGRELAVLRCRLSRLTQRSTRIVRTKDEAHPFHVLRMSAAPSGFGYGGHAWHRQGLGQGGRQRDVEEIAAAKHPGIRHIQLEHTLAT